MMRARGLSLVVSLALAGCQYQTLYDYVKDDHVTASNAGVSADLSIAEGSAAELVIYQVEEGPSYRIPRAARSSDERVVRVAPTGRTARVPDSDEVAPSFVVIAVAPGTAKVVLSIDGAPDADLEVEVTPQER